jgi:hypothetical protein
MSFLINLTDKQFEDSSVMYQVGEIRLGDFYETFWASLSYWNEYDYLNQWKDALKRICNGNNRSCLITSIYDPSNANYIFWWPLYLDENIVHIQNHILFLDELDQPFSEQNPYESIRSRETVSEDSSKISEWDVQVNDIKVYLDFLTGND